MLYKLCCTLTLPLTYVLEIEKNQDLSQEDIPKVHALNQYVELLKSTKEI